MLIYIFDIGIKTHVFTLQFDVHDQNFEKQEVTASHLFIIFENRRI